MIKKSRTPSSSVELLISNTSLISTYGHDTASSFVNVLRDESLDPGSRQTKITDRIAELEKISTDLQDVIFQAPSKQAVRDATSAREKITSLIALGRKVTAITVSEPSTHTEDSDSHKILFFERPGDAPCPSKASVCVTDAQPENHTRNKIKVFGGTALFLIMSLAGLHTLTQDETYYRIPFISDYIPAVLFWAISVIILGKVLSDVLKESIKSRPYTRIDRVTFDKFLHCYTSYSWALFEHYLGFNFMKAPHIVNDAKMTQWFIDANEIFSVVDVKQFKMSKSKNSDKTQKALRRLGQEFNAIMAQTPRVVEEQTQRHNDARKDALATIETKNLISEKNERQEKVIDAYLSKTTSSIS